MATGKVYDYFKDLPPYAKGAVILGVLAIGYFTGKQLIARISKDATEKKAAKSVISAQSDLNDLKKQGVQATISKSQSDAWADQIVAQFRNADLLLQSKALIEKIFNSLKNDADYLMLKISFGIRTYPDAFWGEVKNVSLEGAIQDELMASSIASLNSILSKKRITHQV